MTAEQRNTIWEKGLGPTNHEIEDRNLFGKIVKGYEPNERPWMVFFRILTGNGLLLDI